MAEVDLQRSMNRSQAAVDQDTAHSMEHSAHTGNGYHGDATPAAAENVHMRLADQLVNTFSLLEHLLKVEYKKLEELDIIYEMDESMLKLKLWSWDVFHCDLTSVRAHHLGLALFRNSLSKPVVQSYESAIALASIAKHYDLGTSESPTSVTASIATELQEAVKAIFASSMGCIEVLASIALREQREATGENRTESDPFAYEVSTADEDGERESVIDANRTSKALDLHGSGELDALVKPKVPSLESESFDTPATRGRSRYDSTVAPGTVKKSSQMSLTPSRIASTGVSLASRDVRGDTAKKMKQHIFGSDEEEYRSHPSTEKGSASVTPVKLTTNELNPHNLALHSAPIDETTTYPQPNDNRDDGNTRATGDGESSGNSQSSEDFQDEIIEIMDRNPIGLPETGESTHLPDNDRIRLVNRENIRRVLGHTSDEVVQTIVTDLSKTFIIVVLPIDDQQKRLEAWRLLCNTNFGTPIYQ